MDYYYAEWGEEETKRLISKTRGKAWAWTDEIYVGECGSGRRE
jgi:hypothetical protein